MLLMDSSLVSAQQPSFQQGYHPMHTGKETLPFSLAALQSLVVHIVCQPQVRLESVCSHGATWLNRVGNETVKTFLSQVRNVPQPNAADTLSTFLGGNDDYRLVIRQPSHKTFFLTAPVGFVHLNRSPQAIPTRTNHGSPQLMEPCPSGHIAPKPKRMLKTHRARTIFLAGNVPDSPEPHSQRLPRVLKNRSCCRRRLKAASPTDQTSSRSHPVSGSPTTRADKPFGPPNLNQIFPAGILSRKPFFKFQDRARVVFHTRIKYIISQVESIE